MPSPDSDSPASPNYGGRLGYGIFQWVLRRLGVWPAYALLALVSPYYVLFRPRARRAAAPYLRRRFSERGTVWRFFAAFGYFYRFGQCLIDQGAMGVLGPERFRVEFPGQEDLYRRARTGRGLILLTSHIGNWQTAMANIGSLGVPVHFQFRREAHTEGRHFFDLAGRGGDFRIISPDAFLGGMIEMTNALRAGEAVAIMGDRPFGAPTRRAAFLGDTAAFPEPPYRLAQATGAELFALLTVRTGSLAYRIECVCLSDGEDIADMPSEAQRDALLRRYARCLEAWLEKHPFMWFNFFDFWMAEEKRSAP